MDILKELLELSPRENKTKQVKLLNLSKRAKKDMIFKVRELSYNEIKNILDMAENSPKTDIKMHVVIQGVVEPSLADNKLLEHYHAPTPIELLPKILSAGEIDDLYNIIQQLSGYKQITAQVIQQEAADLVKKN